MILSLLSLGSTIALLGISVSLTRVCDRHLDRAMWNLESWKGWVIPRGLTRRRLILDPKENQQTREERRRQS